MKNRWPSWMVSRSKESDRLSKILVSTWHANAHAIFRSIRCCLSLVTTMFVVWDRTYVARYRAMYETPTIPKSWARHRLRPLSYGDEWKTDPANNPTQWRKQGECPERRHPVPCGQRCGSFGRILFEIIVARLPDRASRGAATTIRRTALKKTEKGEGEEYVSWLIFVVKEC